MTKAFPTGTAAALWRWPEGMKLSMKYLAPAGLALAGSVFAVVRLRGRHPVGNAAVPEPARAVNIHRYLGRWYEIARYEQRFERGCTNVTADYRLRSDGRLAVLNRCRRPNGTMQAAQGVARTVSASNAKLKVRFFGLFSGDYWILDRAEDYCWSIVGEPSGRCLWLLCRQPNPDTELVDLLIQRARELGYDTSALVRTSHGQTQWQPQPSMAS